jgi:hypothetical protein
MNDETKAVVRKVLTDSANTANFFDMNDAERVTWMIVHAYEIGKRQRGHAQGALRERPKANPKKRA